MRPRILILSSLNKPHYLRFLELCDLREMLAKALLLLQTILQQLLSKTQIQKYFGKKNLSFINFGFLAVHFAKKMQYLNTKESRLELVYLCIQKEFLNLYKENEF